MDMATPDHQQRLFFTTGRHGPAVEPVAPLHLRPALLAPYADLTRLRYDFPLVLVDAVDAGDAVRSLTSIVDALLREMAPRGLEGERLRRHVLRLERAIRVMVAGGERGLLSALWTRAASNLARAEDASAEQVLLHVAAKLPVDGQVVDCDPALVRRLFDHLWDVEYARKRRAFRQTVDRLVVRLSDILRASFLNSDAGREPKSLQAALGGTHRELFDFDVMSRLVTRGRTGGELPDVRRARIERTLAVLRQQRFFVDAEDDDAKAAVRAGFRFEDCAAAAAAFRSRLPQIVEVVRAMAIAELDVDGRYVEDKHDPYFEGFDGSGLVADYLALFPDALVCIPPERNDAPENAALLDLLSSGFPVKVVVQTTDLVEDAPAVAPHFAFGVRSMRLANLATGLGGVFVIQAAASHLPALAGALERAFAHRGAALASVYSGAPQAGPMPHYLLAAVASDSRAFPAFVYDPYAGDNQAARFALQANPQTEADWPMASVEFADRKHQRVVERVALTFADFALCDVRYARHFARVPREHWHPALVPAADWLARDAGSQSDLLPYVLGVDAEGVLHRVVVDARLMETAARVRTFWHRLQEQGGIHNSHADIAVAREKAKWAAATAERDATATSSVATAADAVALERPPADATAPDVAAAAPQRNPDEPWIETSRCPSCNECQTINDRMFRYNENKQAYIADITAGSYRQLVEAAEACQVAIIHPGKPRDAAEPGLADLLERAKPFLA